jgi:hypothetical protein
LIDGTTHKILRTDFSTGKKHDKKLFEDSNIRLSKNVELMGDLGYLGINKSHKNSTLPRKSSKNKKLTE